MRRKPRKKQTALLVAMGLLWAAGLTRICAETQKEITVDELSKDGMFVYAEIPWQSSAEEAEKLMGMELQETDREPELEERLCLTAEEQVSFLEEPATMYVTFTGDKLDTVEWETEGENLAEYRDQVKKVLEERFGTEYREFVYYPPESRLEERMWTTVDETTQMQGVLRLLTYYDIEEKVKKVSICLTYEPCPLYAEIVYPE